MTRQHGAIFPETNADRRIVVLDSATFIHGYLHAEGQRLRREVFVNASYEGVYCAHLAEAAEPLGVIGLDCGIGKDGAGIAGLWYLEALRVPAAAADVLTVELGNGRDLYESGVISRANSWALALGIRAGASVRDAARIMLDAPATLPSPDPANRQVMEEGPGGRRVICTNSIIEALPEDRNMNVLCTAGHTGRSVIGYIVNARPYGFICSDGGMGKNQSGISALPVVNAEGIPGASVSAASARMGDGVSTYVDGIISAANDLALAAGVRIGDPARAAAHALLHREP